MPTLKLYEPTAEAEWPLFAEVFLPGSGRDLISFRGPEEVLKD